MYIGDSHNNRIRKVTVSTGIITTYAGTGSNNYFGDNGQATGAALNYPTGIALDSTGISFFYQLGHFLCIDLLTCFPLNLGNMYIADFTNNRIRKVTVSTGIITTIAGTGTNSYSGDNGPATAATLCNPFDVALDASGTYLLCYSELFVVLI